MTLEIDTERVAVLGAQLRSVEAGVGSVRDHLVRLGHRMHMIDETAPAVRSAVRVGEALVVSIALLDRIVQRTREADESAGPVAVSEHVTFAGGSTLCSAIQVVSPIPSRPSTSGATGVIDLGGVVADAGSLARTAATPVGLAGRAAPLGSIAAALADTALCRLGVGSGAGISTHTTVDEEGRAVFEGSRSQHRYLAANGEVLDPDPVRRDRQMWRVEHSNAEGHLTEPYPGYPAYETNAP